MARSSRARGADGGKEIKLGIIGCGGRGSWIAERFLKVGGYRFVVCADYFQDRVDPFGEKYGVPADRRFTTLSGYKRVLDSDCDAVVIESPPYFHPEHAAAAVDAGKHVFIAKPIAVDVPGCKSIADSGRRATEKKLVFLVDFQTRANELYQEAARRVHAGDIGKLVLGEARYPWSGGNMIPPKSPEDQLRRWYCIRSLSGDFIIEQNIHTLDVATWFANADPIHAVGTGGSAGLRRYGDIYDYFAAIFTFPEDFVVSYQGVQTIPGAPNEIPCRIYGSRGMVDTDYFNHVFIRGFKAYDGGPLKGLYDSGAINNIRDFHRFVTEGHCANETVAPSVRSNLTCVLGRTAGYEKRLVTWDEIMKADARLEYDLAGLKA
jgi:predicted dehydrogenase